MLPPAGIALTAALGIRVGRAVVVEHADVGGTELAGVAGLVVVPGAAGARGVAVGTGQVAVLEVQRAAAGGCVVGGTVVALVDTGRRHHVGLRVGIEADL